MWKKILNWLCGTAEKIFKIIISGLCKEVAAILNDDECQQAAIDAIMAVSSKGLKNNEALDAAVEILKNQGIAHGQNAANTILRTLVQNAYCAIKCGEDANES